MAGSRRNWELQELERACLWARGLWPVAAGPKGMRFGHGWAGLSKGTFRPGCQGPASSRAGCSLSCRVPAWVASVLEQAATMKCDRSRRRKAYKLIHRRLVRAAGWAQGTSDSRAREGAPGTVFAQCLRACSLQCQLRPWGTHGSLAGRWVFGQLHQASSTVQRARCASAPVGGRSWPGENLVPHLRLPPRAKGPDASCLPCRALRLPRPRPQQGTGPGASRERGTWARLDQSLPSSPLPSRAGQG